MKKVLWTFWIRSGVFALFLLILFGWWQTGFTDKFLINRAFADASFVLIGLSFALSGVCHFCKTHAWLVYRKYFGVIGFFLVLVHGVLSIIIFKFPYFFSSGANIWSFLLSVVSLLFFAWLAAISTDYWMRRLKKQWRLWLRWGYVAFAFGVVHIIILYVHGWLNRPEKMLEPAFAMAVFGVAVLLLRLALYLQIKK